MLTRKPEEDKKVDQPEDTPITITKGIPPNHKLVSYMLCAMKDDGSRFLTLFSTMGDMRFEDFSGMMEVMHGELDAQLTDTVSRLRKEATQN